MEGLRRWPGLSRYQWRLFAVLALAMLVLNKVYIPLHSADDEDHFALVYAASHLQMGPVASPDPKTSSGSYVDAAIPEVIGYNYRAVRLMEKPYGLDTAWTGKQTFYPLPASVYMPLIYLPQMIAVRMGEAAGLTVESTINLARVVSGLTALAIIAAALAFLPEALGLFALLVISLPRSLLIFASNSADPMTHAITIALLAFFYRAVTSEWTPKAWHHGLAALGLLAIAGVRPPMAALGLLLIYAAWRRRNIAGMALPVLAVVLAASWWAVVLPAFHDIRCPLGSSLSEKAAFFAAHGPQLLIDTFAQRGAYYWGSLIGELGYGDARIGHLNALAPWVYWLASAMLLLGAMSLGDPAGQKRQRIEPLAKALPVLIALAVVTGLFFSLNFACTKMGNDVIEGVQGRYFVTPLLLLATAAATMLSRIEACVRLVRLALPVFLVINLAVLVSEGLSLYWRP